MVDITYESFESGVTELHFAAWRDFVNFIHEVMATQPEFIWRGQRVQSWPLQPGFERDLVAMGLEPDSIEADKLRFEHLQRFKLAARGRLDPRDFEERELLVERDDTRDDVPIGSSAAEREENNWWAVGQHYGLRTPLLDWSTSPFVAAYFAFNALSPADNKEGRALYALNRELVSQKADELRQDDPEYKVPVVDFIEPLYKDNPRLVSQGGLFTRSPNGLDVSAWIEEHYEEEDEDYGAWLLKLVLPDEDREYILQMLNRMNINHQSLFPDLYGVTEFVNMKLTLKNY